MTYQQKASYFLFLKREDCVTTLNSLVFQQRISDPRVSYGTGPGTLWRERKKRQLALCYVSVVWWCLLLILLSHVADEINLAVRLIIDFDVTFVLRFDTPINLH